MTTRACKRHAGRKGKKKKRLAIYDPTRANIARSVYISGVRMSMRKSAQNRGVLFPLFEKVQVSAVADRDMDVSTLRVTLNILRVFYVR